MPTLDLREEARAIDLRIDPIELTERDRASAIATWRGRMINEHISSQVFAGLIPQLMRADVRACRQAAVADMIADEMRHARQCASVVHALGGEPIADLPKLETMPTHDDVSPLEALLRNVISVSCLSETVAVALIGAERLESGPKPIADTLRTILADEVQHARFGWTLLDELSPRIDAKMRESLSEYLCVALDHLVRHELRHLPDLPAPSEEAASVGVCDGRAARALFFDTVVSVIVPGLERHGFSARAAWHRSRSAA